MKIDLLEQGKGILRIKIDEDTTLLSVLNEYIWNQEPSFSAFAKEHIYLSNPELIVRSKNPKKDISNATKELLNNIEALKQEVTRL